MIDATSISRFRALFDGLQRHYGTDDIRVWIPKTRNRTSASGLFKAAMFHARMTGKAKPTATESRLKRGRGVQLRWTRRFA